MGDIIDHCSFVQIIVFICTFSRTNWRSRKGCEEGYLSSCLVGCGGRRVGERRVRERKEREGTCWCHRCPIFYCLWCSYYGWEYVFDGLGSFPEWPPSSNMPRNEIRCACTGRIEEGKSRCTKRITRKGKKFSAQAFAHLIPDYDYVKDDSLSEKCYERLRKEKIAILASQEHCVCQGRTTDPGAKCRVKRSEDDSSCSAGGFEETIQARDSGYKYVEGDLLFPALGRFQAELNNHMRIHYLRSLRHKGFRVPTSRRHLR